MIFSFGFDIDFSKKLQKFIDDHSKYGRFKKVGDHVVPLSVEVKPLDVKLTDFYYSFDFSEFDFTECPHKLYRLRAIVTKESGEINGLTVTADDVPCEIDDGHIGVIYLRNGEYHVKASTNDDYYCSRDITIDKAALDVDMPLKKEPFCKVSMGAASCAAITEADKLYVWGSNAKHQLGLTGIESTSTPQFLMDDVRDVCVGDYYGLALKNNGDVYMWGTGNLAYNSSVIVNETPKRVLTGAKFITCAASFACAAIKENDDLYTWGSSSSGILFNGNPKDVTSFTCVLHNIRDFAFGGSAFSAYIDTNDNMYMIGSNSWGQIGDGKGKLGNTRTSKFKVMTNVKSMSLGYAHSACITKDGKLYMWGRGSNGEFGDGTTTSRVLKPNVMIWKNLKSVKLGYDMSAVIDEDNYMHVTGRNTYGQLGDYTTNDSTVWEMFLPNVRTMSTANVGHSTAAITYDGDLYTCGYNIDGQLGYGTNAGTQNDNPEPQKVILHPSGGGRSVPASTAAEAEVNRQTHFEGLTPNKLYNFYSMRSKTAEKPFSRYNVWYMAQLRADDNGVIDVDFYQDSTVDVVNFVVAIDYSVGRFVLGDADGNGDVDINDATWVRRYAALIGTPFESDTLMRGDVDQNNLLEIIDATLIQKALAEMDTAYAA